MKAGGIKSTVRRAIVQVVKPICPDHEILQTNGNHIKVVLRRGSLTRFVICANTASDIRSLNNFAAQVKKELRLLAQMEANMLKP
jgi:hypothetical protein